MNMIVCKKKSHFRNFITGFLRALIVCLNEQTKLSKSYAFLIAFELNCQTYIHEVRKEYPIR